MEQSLIDQFADAIKQDPKEKKTTYSAIVSRIDEEGVIWVYVAGSDKETPTASSATEVKKGDTVTVEWRNNKLYIAGNYSSPSVGTQRANAIEETALGALSSANAASAAAASAKESAEIASGAAAKAVEDAASASAAASAASASAAAADAKATAAGNAASAAQSSANAAGNAASAAQSSANAAGQAASRAQAAADAAQGDINAQKEYFWHDAFGAHILSDADEVTGKRYRTDLKGAGQEIFELDGSTETSVAKFGAGGGRIGEENGPHTVIDEDGMQIYSVDANDNVILLAIIGYGEGASESSKADAPFFLIDKGELIEAIDIRNVNNVYRGALYYDGSISTQEYLCLKNHPSGYVPPITDESTFVPIRSRTGNFSFGQGVYVIASGYASHAEGGSDTTAEGIHTDMSAAIGSFSHAEGSGGIAVGRYSHAEGDNTTAKGTASHAEGFVTVAEGRASHAEGDATTASGYASHAEGDATNAIGDYSHTQNEGTYASRRSQTALGEYNKPDPQGSSKSERGKYVVIVGNGSSYSNQSNGLAITWDGNVEMALETTAQSGVDKEIYDALVSLGWDSDVIV